MSGKALLKDLSVPFGNRYSVRLRSDSVPEQLDVVDLLLDRQIVEAGRGECQSVRHPLDTQYTPVPERIALGSEVAPTIRIAAQSLDRSL